MSFNKLHKYIFFFKVKAEIKSEKRIVYCNGHAEVYAPTELTCTRSLMANSPCCRERKY
ncbi:unnamed protein product [Ixodes pacificus]